MAKYLENLDLEISSGASPVLKGKLRAKKAMYLARVGKFSDAKSHIASLRREFGDARSGLVTTWIMLAEGLLHNFESLSIEALDRIARCHILAKSLNDKELIALSSAWKAHIEFERSKFRQMQLSLKDALDFGEEHCKSALTRAATILCFASIYCGDQKNSQKWSQKAHQLAVTEGDQASIEALVYNRAAFNLASIRARMCFGENQGDRLAIAKLEIESARNLIGFTGIASLPDIVIVCEARLKIALGDFAEAIPKLESLTRQRTLADYNFSDNLLTLEIAYCKNKIKPAESAQRPEALLWHENFEKLDIDEQLIAAWMILDINSHRRDSEKLQDDIKRLELLRASYSHNIGELRDIISVF